MERFFSSLRFKLILLILFATLPVAGLMLYTSGVEKKTASDYVQKQALRFANLSVAKESHLISGTQKLLITLSRAPQVRIGDTATCSSFLKDLLGQIKGYANIGVFRPDGTLYCSAMPTEGKINASDRSFFKRVVKTRDFVIGDYQMGRVIGRPVVVFAYPILDDDMIKRIVFTSIDMGWLNREFGKEIAENLPEGSTLTKIDSNGVILVRYPGPENWVGEKYAELKDVAFETILSQKRGMFEGTGKDNVSRLYAFTPLFDDMEKGDVYVILGIPKKSVFDEVNRLLNINLVLIVIVFLITVTLAWLGSEAFILSRINDLVKASRRIAKGDLDARTDVPHGKGEIGELARSFDEMAESIQTRQAELQDSEERYRALFHQAQDPIFLFEVETGRMVEVNDAFSRVFGYSREDIARMKMFDIPVDSIENIHSNIQKVLQVGSTSIGERIYRRPDGSTVPVEVYASLIKLKDKPYIMAIAHDLTECRRTEELIGRLSHAIEQSPVSIVITDTEGNIEYVNPKFVEITGYTFEEVIGKNPRILKSGKTPPEEYERLWETITSGETWRGVFHNRKKNGELFHESAVISPVKNRQGVVTHYIGIKEDITELKKLQEQLLHAQKMEALGTFSGGIAHDFNNILTAIMGFGSLMQMNVKGDDPLRPYLKEILAAVERATNLTQGLLTFSRKQIISPRSININEIIKRVQKMLSRIIGEDIELRTILTDKDLTVKADVGQMEQVLMNLATNARDAMPDGGVLIIETELVKLDEEYMKTHAVERPGMYALISVTDTGTGMDEKTKERIFEPYFTTKDTGKGTGLGLSMVYGIIRQHDGYINCYSELGKGTTFKIYLPLAKLEVKEERIISLPPARGTETILLAEDDASVRKFTKATLEQWGYTVIEAEDGEDAIKAFKEYRDKIQLLVSDVIMPKMNGKEAYEEIKKITPDIKAIFMSGYTANIIHKKGILEEGINFISKPISPNELLRKVREVLDKIN